MPVTSKC